MKIKLKEIKKLDFDKVVEIFYSVNLLKYGEKRKIYKQSIEKAFLNSQYVISAWMNNELIGFCRVLTDNSLFATIWNLIVVPNFQAMGIGKLLVQKCLEKYPKIHFFIIADKENYKFYEKLGFKLHPHGMYLEKGKKVSVIYN